MSPLKTPRFSFRAGTLLGILAALIIVGYTLYAALPYLLGPSLSVTETSANGLTTITGITGRVAFLSVDGAPVPISEDGSFSIIRAYPPGYTEAMVTVKDRFGRTLTKNLTFITSL